MAVPATGSTPYGSAGGESSGPDRVGSGHRGGRTRGLPRPDARCTPGKPWYVMGLAGGCRRRKRAPRNSPCWFRGRRVRWVVEYKYYRAVSKNVGGRWQGRAGRVDTNLLGRGAWLLAGALRQLPVGVVVAAVSDRGQGCTAVGTRWRRTRLPVFARRARRRRARARVGANAGKVLDGTLVSNFKHLPFSWSCWRFHGIVTQHYRSHTNTHTTGH